MEFTNFTTKFVKKGTILQQAGDINLKSYVVKQGLLRSYIIDDKGKEHIFMFAPEDWIIGDIYAAFKQKETGLFIDVLEDSEVLIVGQRLDDLSAVEIKEGIEKLLNRLGVMQNRILMQLSSSALVRYQHFIEVYPELLERVPQKMIASYLGITPPALSKIRSNWSKSKP